MSNLKALVVDDEALACDMLEYLIHNNIPQITTVKKCTSSVQALGMIKDFEPDILFLDVQMPFMNGFELLQMIGEKKFGVIFTTAFNKYAIQAIRFSALDYLLKPVDTDELKAAVNRYVMSRKQDTGNEELFRNFLVNLQNKEKAAYKLALNGGNGIQLIPPAEIMRCEAVNNYTRFYLVNGKPLLVSKTIKEYDELLHEQRFFRVHKSHLVNLDYVKEVTTDSQLRMKDGALIEISRRRKQEVLEALGIRK